MILNDLSRQKKFSELETQNFETQGVWAEKDPIVYGIASDTKYIQPGYIFFAINGVSRHGAEFAMYAIERGAIVIVTDVQGAKILQKERIKSAIAIVSNPRKRLAEYAVRWNGLQPENQIAVTGTNGKTSVCHFVRQIWELLGYRAASIGTLGVQGEVNLALKNTTPDPLVLHDILRKLTRSNIEYVSMEASSHGLDQYRLDGVVLTAAAFTNLSRDHFDYHTDEDEYLATKCILFDRVLPFGKTAVLNFDDPHSHTVKLVCENAGHKVITVGHHMLADLKVSDHRYDLDGQTLKLSYLGDEHVVSLSLVGSFQVTNVLVAAALVVSLGVPLRQVFEFLPQLKAVPGRMELVGTKNFKGRVYVDYAHTPEALMTALKSLIPHKMGKLFLVFGAGGDRDPGKRPLMGKVAGKYADNVFVTDDNPRHEEPEKIRSEILKECPGATEIPDRAEAILTAVNLIREGDILLIAGKGHETGQIIGDDILPFNDRECVSMALALLEGKKA